ncbi:hypothetical protein LCGC14_2507180 [marine sediment metagenome]|uniref:DUF4345 domain-containing protein n=1 Tax=marine sediment metagenome TaxID=412755 RepID=A0A0F9B0Z3_9ZZZZ
MARYERLLKWLLRATGVACCLALPAVVMPRSWMDIGHQWLGMGPLPEGAIVEYLARSLSALYAFFGGLCLLVSFDIHRHSVTITFIGITHLVFAGVLLGIDLTAGLPWYWTAPEVSSAVLFGLAVLALQYKTTPRP